MIYFRTFWLQYRQKLLSRRLERSIEVRNLQIVEEAVRFLWFMLWYWLIQVFFCNFWAKSYEIKYFNVDRQTTDYETGRDGYAVVHQEKVATFAHTLLLEFACWEEINWTFVILHFYILVVAY